MSYESMLVHTATITRRQSGHDRFNQQSASYTLLADGVPCRASQGGGRQRDDEQSTRIVSGEYQLFLPAGQDLTEDDRVVVTSADGITLVQDADVVHVRVITDGAGNEHHREANLTVVRGT